MKKPVMGVKQMCMGCNEIESVNMTLTKSGQFVIRQAKELAYYYPEKPLKAELTASEFQSQTNITKRMGYFSSSLQILNGFSVQNAGNISDLVHSGGIKLLSFVMQGDSDKDQILQTSGRLGSLIDKTTDEIYVTVTPITNGAQALVSKN
jgi:hypothetical protein